MSKGEFLEGLEPPTPPPGLREVALRAGRTAMAERPEPDAWALLFQSRVLRAAWALAVVALAATHALVSTHSPSPVSATPLDPEVADIVHVSGLDNRTATLIRASGLEGDPL